MTKRRRLPVVAAAALLVLGIAGCALTGPTSPAPASPTPTTTPETTAPPTPEAGPITAFQLSGSELIGFDDAGTEADRVSLDDSAALRSLLVSVYGEPTIQAATADCGYEYVIWFNSEVYFAHKPEDPTSGVVVVKGEHGIRPSAGPGYGEATASFTATLPADQVTGGGYVYDVVGTDADGSPTGGVVHGYETVDSIVSPSSMLTMEFCG